MVGLWLDMGAMNHSVEAVEWENGLDWLILDENGQVLNLMQEGEGPEISYEEGGLEGQKTAWKGKEYLAYTAASQEGGRRYVLLMSESLISARAGQIRNAFLAGLLLCTCLGFAVAAEMMRVNYSPLKKIMELFRTQGGDQEDWDNEYQYLENSAVSFFKEHSDFRQRVEENRRTLRQYYLASLLEAPYDAARDEQSRAAAPGMDTGSNLVLLFHIQEKEGDSMDGLKRFIVRNVFGEGIGEHFRQETVELGETVAMVLNLGRGQEEYEELLMDTADGLQRFIQENFGFHVAVLAGEPHEGLAGIHESFLEAVKAEEFLDAPDVDFISYREIRNRSKGSYAYTREQEERILGALVSRNTELAVSYINKVLDVNFLENRLSPDMRRCLLYDLAGTLMKASSETGLPAKNERGGVQMEWELEELAGKKSLKEVKAILKKMAEDVSETEPDGAQENQSRQLCQEVLSYINANYSDPDLNISQTGQHFHMTPAYLSSIFRREMGESLLKVITQTRVRKAEELLSQGVSVVEAGERVGFRDSSTFIRTFKKYTGVTPGQIKGTK